MMPSLVHTSIALVVTCGLSTAAKAAAVPGAPLKIDPAFAVNNTVYHVNPHQYGWNPLNMDTADAAGDLFFDMHNVYLGNLECANHASSHGCDNPEAVAPNLVVNKLVMTVDNRFSGYARCNIGVNGSDGHGHPCKDDTYCCFCESATDPWGPSVPCNRTVGRENVREHFSSGSSSYGCKAGGQPSPDYMCWRAKLGQKFTNATPGWWYSSLANDNCAINPNGCTWQASIVKIVDKKCADEVLWGEVKKYDSTGCFKSCPGRFNTSDPCQIGCFFESVLGPDAGKPGGAVTGMPLPMLLSAWDKPFSDESEGGCPALPPKPNV